MDGGVTAAVEVLTPLTARGVVLLGVGGGPVVLCAVDWVGIANESHDRLKDALARGCDTAPSRVALHTVHQHDAPGSDSATDRLLQAHDLAGALRCLQASWGGEQGDDPHSRRPLLSVSMRPFIKDCKGIA